jgi:hypothetical protein
LSKKKNIKLFGPGEGELARTSTAAVASGALTRIALFAVAVILANGEGGQTG